MQLVNMTQKSLQALKEKLRDRHCDICHHNMLTFSSPIIKHGKDTRLSRIQCMSCLTIYNNELEIEWVGLSTVEGKA